VSALSEPAQDPPSYLEKKLGVGTARLYERLVALQKVAEVLQAEPVVRAIARIVLDALCGSFHDYRSGRPLPKGDLIEAIRAVPPHPSLDGQRAAIEAEIVAGWYDEDEDEGRRWVARRIPPRKPGHRTPQDVEPEAIELTPREYRVFVWLYRYVEVYRISPLLREVAAGLEVTTLHVREVLGILERKGAAASLGGHRGWVPTRAP
jgi:hypothetical protein